MVITFSHNRFEKKKSFPLFLIKLSRNFRVKFLEMPFQFFLFVFPIFFSALFFGLGFLTREFHDITFDARSPFQYYDVNWVYNRCPSIFRGGRCRRRRLGRQPRHSNRAEWLLMDGIKRNLIGPAHTNERNRTEWVALERATWPVPAEKLIKFSPPIIGHHHGWLNYKG